MTALLEPPTTAPVLIPQYTASGYDAWLFYEIGHQITTDPASWDQNSWGWHTECGTQYCIAGWAVHIAGLPVNWQRHSVSGEWGMSHLTDGTPVYRAAGDLLRLDEAQAERLFIDFQGDKVDSFWDAVEDVTGNEISYLGYREWLTSR